MKKIIYLFLFILLSCQPVENIDQIVFDNSQLPEISIICKEIKIIETYAAVFDDPYIDHSLLHSPKKRLINWIETNFNSSSNQNVLEINIIDASIKKTEQPNLEAKKYEEKNIYKYELFYLVEFNLYDDSKFLIASTNVESYHSTTSGKFISIAETERIIDELILESLRDFSNESKTLINEYMKEYII